MSTLEWILAGSLAVLVGARLLLYVWGGVRPGSHALSPAQHLDEFRAAVARATKGRRARLVPPRGGPPRPGVVVRDGAAHVLFRLLSNDERARGLDAPGDPGPAELPRAHLGELRCEMVLRVAVSGAPATVLWSRTRDPRAPASEDGLPPRFTTGDEAFDGWVAVRCADPARARAALGHADVREIARRLLLVNVPYGARLTLDAHGIEWSSLVTSRTPPEWVGLAVHSLARVGQAFAGQAHDPRRTGGPS